MRSLNSVVDGKLITGRCLNRGAMKLTFLRTISLFVCLALGLVSSSLVTKKGPDGLISPVKLPDTAGCVWDIHADYTVISDSSDGEYYVGKRQVQFTEILTVLSRSQSDTSKCHRAFYFERRTNEIRNVKSSSHSGEKVRNRSRRVRSE